MVGLGVQLNVPALLAHANSDLDRIDRTICSQRDIQLHRTVCSTGMRTFPRSSTEAQILGGQTCILNAWTSRTEETGESNLCSGCLTDGSPMFPHTRGRSGYVVTYRVPPARGGADAPYNMQWQTIADTQGKTQIGSKPL